MAPFPARHYVDHAWTAGRRRQPAGRAIARPPWPAAHAGGQRSTC